MICCTLQMLLTRVIPKVSIPAPLVFKDFINKLEAIRESRLIKFTADLKLR